MRCVCPHALQAGMIGIDIRDRIGRTGLGTGRVAAAQITFDHRAGVMVVIDGAERAGDGAHLAADADIADDILGAGQVVEDDRLHRAGVQAPRLGAVARADLVVVGLEGKLLLFTPGGELIERLDGAAGVPAGMQAIGLTPGGRLAIQAAHGFYQTDKNFLEWHETPTLDAVWSTPTLPAPALRTALQQAWRSTGLPLERILLDIHSGRILGGWGVYLVDAAAVLFLLLATSGVWLWGKRRASIKAHQRSKHSKHV